VLVCVIAFGVGLQTHCKDSFVIHNWIGQGLRAPMYQPILGISGSSKSVFVKNLAVNVDRRSSRPKYEIRWHLPRNVHDVVVPWTEDCRSHFEILGRFWKGHAERMALNPLMYPLAHFVSRSLAVILNVNLGPYDAFANLKLSPRNRDIRPELSLACVLQDVRLPIHIVSLTLDSPKGSEQQPNLQSANQDQQAAENPQPPIKPTPCYRHGGKFADSYGMLCIIVTLLTCIPLCGWGLIRITDGHRLSGWLLVLAAIVLDVLACASGVIGCLPWDWGKCLHDGQEHSQYQYFHGTHTVTQNGDSLLILLPSRKLSKGGPATPAFKKPLEFLRFNHLKAVSVIYDYTYENTRPKSQVASTSLLAEGIGLKLYEKMVVGSQNSVTSICKTEPSHPVFMSQNNQGKRRRILYPCCNFNRIVAIIVRSRPPLNYEPLLHGDPLQANTVPCSFGSETGSLGLILHLTQGADSYQDCRKSSDDHGPIRPSPWRYGFVPNVLRIIVAAVLFYLGCWLGYWSGGLDHKGWRWDLLGLLSYLLMFAGALLLLFGWITRSHYHHCDNEPHLHGRVSVSQKFTKKDLTTGKLL